MAPRARRKRRLGRPRNADRDPLGPSSRDRILAAASKLFAERGHDATTMEDVAARAGFTVGALYRHFGGKPDLLLAVIGAALERIPAFQQRAARPRARLSETIGTYVTPHYRSNPDHRRTNNWTYHGNLNPYTGRVGHSWR